MGETIIPTTPTAGNELLLESLGDQAVLVRTPDEASALRLAAAVCQDSPDWLEDIVQAYTSVAVFYAAHRIAQTLVVEYLRSLRLASGTAETGTLHDIPCCYELGPDLLRVAERTGLDPSAVIAAHSGSIYTVYAIGFCPGFPYLGYLPTSLQGVPRLETPRVRVEPGSVGLTGRQTGIYPEPRPGGWNLIGRTPLCLVDVDAGYFPLRTGDRVRFVPITRERYQELAGQRLTSAGATHSVSTKEAATS